MLALLTLALLAVLVGCTRPVDEEPQTSSEVASRGKYTRGMVSLKEATFTESERFYVEAISAFSESLVHDADYSMANAMMGLAIAELTKSATFSAATVVTVPINLESTSKYASLAVQHNPDSAEGHAVLGMVAVRMSDFEAANGHIKAARSANDGCREYLIAMGDMLWNAPYSDSKRQAKERAEALKYYRKAVLADEAFGLAYMRLLDGMEALNDIEGLKETLVMLKVEGYDAPAARAVRYRALGIKLP
jgi:tetratricopeptide (TPR) repeat protein